MWTAFAQEYNLSTTPQTTPAPGRAMSTNSKATCLAWPAKYALAISGTWGICKCCDQICGSTSRPCLLRKSRNGKPIFLDESLRALCDAILMLVLTRTGEAAVAAFSTIGGLRVADRHVTQLCQNCRVAACESCNLTSSHFLLQDFCQQPSEH